MRRILIGMALLVLAGLAPPAAAQEVVRIAAVVNDDVISVYDLSARLRLILVSTRLPDTPQNRRRLTAQVLRSLIDEKLQLQEAKRLNIAIDTAEIERALGQVEKRNNIPAGQLSGFLGRAGVAVDTLIHQVRSAIAWNKVLNRESRKITQIGADEIDEALAEIEANRGRPQSQVSEIFLSVDRPEQEEDIGTIASRLVEQIRKGANFGALARQLSQSATAAVEGDIGWVQEGQLVTELDVELKRMRVGEVSEPIRTTAGFHILYLRDRRVLDEVSDDEATIELEHLFIPLPPDARQDDHNATIALADTVAETVATCADLKAVREDSNAPQFPLPGSLKVKDLAPRLREPISALSVGQTGAPLVIANGVLLFMVCSRTDPPGLANREEIGRTLVNQRRDTLARRYMRDLRRAAFVDLRV